MHVQMNKRVFMEKVVFLNIFELQQEAIEKEGYL